jgi:hypothetical protein
VCLHFHGPYISWAGSQFGVAWSEWGEGDAGGVRFTRLDIDGNALMEEAVVHEVPGSPFDLGWTGRRFGLLHSGHRDDGVAFIGLKCGDGNGEFDDAGVEIPLAYICSPISPTMVWSGSEFGVLWSDKVESYELFFARIGLCE